MYGGPFVVGETIGERWAAAVAELGGFDYEGKPAIVVDRYCRGVGVDDAFDYVAGYTCANGISGDDDENQWVRSKRSDTFCPLGPALLTDVDDSDSALDLDLETRISGDDVQEMNTEDLVFGVADLIADSSTEISLEAGDVILTGAPPGVGPLERGDHVAVEIEGIGTLENTVV